MTSSLELRRILTLVALVVSLAALPPAYSQVTFTLQGHASGAADGTAASLGFASNEAFSWTFTMASGYPAADEVSDWDSSVLGLGLWTAITGTGLSGTYSPTSNATETLYNYIGDDMLGLEIYGNGDPIGLSVNSYALASLYATEAEVVGANFVLVDKGAPDTYFSGYLGTWTYAADLNLESMDEDTTTLTIDTLTISAIPEPAGYALLAGFAALSVVVLRRRCAGCFTR